MDKTPLKELLKRRNAQKLDPNKVKQVTNAQMLEIDRQARAYGWEIGRGKPMSEQLDASEDNPFLDPNWRDTVEKGDSDARAV